MSRTCTRAMLFGLSSAPHTSAGESRQAMRSQRQMAPLAGMGVGLPLARVHVRLMGGDLTLEARAGDGLDAHATIPTDGNGVPWV